MVLLIIIQLCMIVLFFLLGYFIVKKEAYYLISGFKLKPEEEQQILIKNGYPQAIGKSMMYSSIILLIGLGLSLLKIPYIIEISWFVMLVYLFAHLFSIQRLDKSENRKNNILLLIISTASTLIILAGSFYIGFQSNQVTISEGDMKINGVYGVTWAIDELTAVELVDEIPTIERRTNGFSMANRLKGKFLLEELGNGKLFLYYNNPPYLYIEKGDDYVFINAKNTEQTAMWYEHLMKSLKPS